jgi:hypothetical protein
VYFVKVWPWGIIKEKFPTIPSVPSKCFSDITLQPPYGPGFYSASDKYISWGVKLIGAAGWQLYYIPVPIVLKSRNLNLLEPPSQELLYFTTLFLSHKLRSPLLFRSILCSPKTYPFHYSSTLHQYSKNIVGVKVKFAL